jgi:hypothetical protein
MAQAIDPLTQKHEDQNSNTTSTKAKKNPQHRMTTITKQLNM